MDGNTAKINCSFFAMDPVEPVQVPLGSQDFHLTTAVLQYLGTNLALAQDTTPLSAP